MDTCVLLILNPFKIFIYYFFSGKMCGKKFLTAFLLNLRERQPNAKFKPFIGAHPPANAVTVTSKKIISPPEEHTVSVQLPASIEMPGTGVYDSTALIQANKEISVCYHSHKEYSTGATVINPLTGPVVLSGNPQCMISHYCCYQYSSRHPHKSTSDFQGKV